VSNPFAVAAVTATFAQLLGRVIEEPTLAGATVTTTPPDLAAAGGTGRRLNLFLFGVSPSAAWQNADLPLRRADGSLRTNPVTALELHYLLTAYGQNDDDLDAQHLLAHAMSLVNDEPVLRPEQIEAAIAAQPAVAGSDLPDQVELVRICPEPMSLEEVSKLWTTFQDTSYRLSTAYQASIVLIERPHPTASAPPVHRPGIVVVPIRRPVIAEIVPVTAVPGRQVEVRGRNLRAPDLEVLFGGAPLTPDTVTNTAIGLTVPGDRPAGVTAVQVVHPVAMGDPPIPHRGFQSNVAAFVLAPRIDTPTPVSVAAGSSLTLDFTPAVGRDQRFSVLIGDREIAVSSDDIGTTPVTSMAFPVPADFPTGTFLLRLRVDGIDSPLEVDPDPASPTFDQYVGPNVTVT
jgi:hypothetical protein